MKLRDAREYYTRNSAKLSDIVRQLGFAGIALVWIFRVQVSGDQRIPHGLLEPSILIVVALALDFLQYCSGALAWGVYHRVKERQGTSEEADFLAPPAINWAALVFFWGKVVAIGIAYGYLLAYLARRFG